MLHAIGLQVPDAGGDDGRYAAAGDEEDADQGEVAQALQRVGRDRFEQRDRLFCVNAGVVFFSTPVGAWMAAMSWAVSQDTSPLAASCR
jgi:hypothetical protein